MKPSNASNAGTREIIDRIKGDGSAVEPEQFVDRAVEMMGPVNVADVTRQSLVDTAAEEGNLTFGNDTGAEQSEHRITRMLQLIVASREFQFA